ncbi:MAG: CAAX prenyl protease-related protein [Planctomycetota bacterium]
MESPEPHSEDENSSGQHHPPCPRGPFFQEYPWLAMLGPMFVYLAVPMFFSAAEPGDHLTPDDYERVRSAYAANYLWKYTAMASLAVPLAFFMPRSLQLPRFRVSLLAVVVGVVGVVLWVGIDWIGLNDALRKLFGEDSLVITVLGLTPRDAFDPNVQFDGQPASYWWFLAVRFTGLVLLVPLCEELMLRGWLVRMVDNPAFWQVPFGEVTLKAAAIGVGFAMLYHPEKLPALAYFSLTMWLMLKTKNYWDCVASHAVTNLLLGVWVLWQGAWHLW